MSNTLIDILKINSNDFEFDRKIYYRNIDKLRNDLEKFVEVETTEISEMMDSIVGSIGLTPETYGHSPVIHDTATNIYQLCHATESNDTFNKVNNDKPKNNISSYLTGETITGATALISSSIDPINYLCKADTIKLDDLADILYKKFIHRGIFITANDLEEVIEFEYFDHPIELYNVQSEDEFNNYKILSCDFLGFNLSMVIQINPTNDVVNKRATRIYGTNKINGDVLLISKSAHEYYDLTLDLYKKINCLSYGPLKSRLLSETEKETDIMVDIKNGMNKYVILNEKYSGYKKVCNNNNCEKKDLKVLACDECHRMRYDSIKCLREDWMNHKSECLINTDCINKKK